MTEIQKSDLTTHYRISWVIIGILLLLGITYLYLTAKVMSASQSNQRYSGIPVCTPDMFSGDLNAYWACRALDALQNNWFPSPIAGLFTYEDWNGFDGFWQNGIVLETLANYNIYTNSSRYQTTVLKSIRSLVQLTNAYAPLPSCDDELWYGLAYMRIYEATGDTNFLHRARDIMNWSWENCWDYSMKCHGGLFFDTSRNYKSTITNAEALMLSPWLYIHTKEHVFMDNAHKLLDYILQNDIIDLDTYEVFDSIDLNSCLPNHDTLFTYECGMAVGAMVKMFTATNNHTYLSLAHKIASSNIWRLSMRGILTESCDNTNCAEQVNKDAKSFKGIFVRNIRYLMDLSDTDERSFYQKWLQHNIDSVLSNAMCETVYNETINETSHCQMVFQDGQPFNTPTGPVFNENWSGPFEYSTPIEQTSALTLLVSSILPNTRCSGEHCNFDPAIPDTNGLTCEGNPCPDKFTCCSWNQKYHTCCTPGQKCIQGGCY